MAFCIFSLMQIFNALGSQKIIELILYKIAMAQITVERFSTNYLFHEHIILLLYSIASMYFFADWKCI